MKYIPVIGIEVHVELKTRSKMFCGCSAHHFQVKPNTHTCPVCLGLPGALPVPNKKAIEWCLLIGKALECQIAEESKFDRKNYFYPDLAKGYQISQYDKPFCLNGQLKAEKNVIRINRVHMEEDTGKLLHKIINGEKASLIDFNRCGVPLVEIVTEPDIHSIDKAVIYLKKLQQLIRYLDVSDCDMEKGSMRCEVNISLSRGKGLPKYKVEVKNINSFKFVKKAIEYEMKRQTRLLEKGETPLQETRGFNEARQTTYPQRSKEEAHDYRYFPEPDIPEFRIKNSELKIKDLPELPDEKIQRLVKDYGLSEAYVSLLMAQKSTAEYFEKAVKAGADALEIAKVMINKRVNIKKFTPQQLVQHLKKQKSDTVSDQDQLNQMVVQVIDDNTSAVVDFKKGKQAVIGFLIGQVMKASQGKADASLVRKIMLAKLKASL